MKNTAKILSLIIVLSMLLSMSVYATPDPDVSQGSSTDAVVVPGDDDASEEDADAEPEADPVREDSGEAPEDEDAPQEEAPAPQESGDAPISLPGLDTLPAGELIQADSLPPSEYAGLTGYAGRDDTGAIYVGQDVTGQEEIGLDETVTGEGYTAVYVHGQGSEAAVSGALVVSDQGQGENANDFSGQGAALVAHEGARLALTGAAVGVIGLGRAGLVVSEGSVAAVTDSQLSVLGGDPLTGAYEGYVSSTDRSAMLSPPWGLGVSGGARGICLVGQSPALNLVRTALTVGGWGGVSTDASGDSSVTSVDSTIRVLPAGEGGLDSGWAILGWAKGEYGSGYGTAYTGGADQYHYGLQISGATYGAVLNGANTAYYGSSAGSIPLYDGDGELVDTIQGQGQPTVIRSVFGFLMAGDVADGVYVDDESWIKTASATVLYKDGNGGFFFNNADLDPDSGVLVQMMDNDDDGRIGMPSDDSQVYSDGKLGIAPGFPCIAYPLADSGPAPGEMPAAGKAAPEEEAAPEDEESPADEAVPEDEAAPAEVIPEDETVDNAVPEDGGPQRLNVFFTNGVYKGDLYNGTGYYGQSGDVLAVTVGSGALLNGDMDLASTVKAIPYSDRAMEAVAACGDAVGYVLLNGMGEPTSGNEGDAAYIQFTDYTAAQYYLQGQVQNKFFYNGSAAIDVTVEAGGVWVVGNASLITSLTVEEGGVVYGRIVDNGDGSMILYPAAVPLESGVYGQPVQGDLEIDAPDPGQLDEEAPVPEEGEDSADPEEPPAPEEAAPEEDATPEEEPAPEDETTPEDAPAPEEEPAPEDVDTDAATEAATAIISQAVVTDHIVRRLSARAAVEADYLKLAGLATLVALRHL